ncbi:MAG: hypothetical protein OT477_24025, partial [Chloroflexi bacterium]|nr:hypothetical protein [Chloroflexota bacterium]
MHQRHVPPSRPYNSGLGWQNGGAYRFWGGQKLQTAALFLEQSALLLEQSALLLEQSALLLEQSALLLEQS